AEVASSRANAKRRRTAVPIFVISTPLKLPGMVYTTSRSGVGPCAPKQCEADHDPGNTLVVGTPCARARWRAHLWTARSRLRLQRRQPVSGGGAENAAQRRLGDQQSRAHAADRGSRDRLHD